LDPHALPLFGIPGLILARPLGQHAAELLNDLPVEVIAFADVGAHELDGLLGRQVDDTTDDTNIKKMIRMLEDTRRMDQAVRSWQKKNVPELLR
jgi:hypothetical protein